MKLLATALSLTIVLTASLMAKTKLVIINDTKETFNYLGETFTPGHTTSFRMEEGDFVGIRDFLLNIAPSGGKLKEIQEGQGDEVFSFILSSFTGGGRLLSKTVRIDLCDLEQCPDEINPYTGYNAFIRMKFLTHMPIAQQDLVYLDNHQSVAVLMNNATIPE